MIKEGAVRRTILAALHDAGIEQPCPLDIPEEDLEKLKRREYFSLPAEEENTLEEFAGHLVMMQSKKLRNESLLL